MSKLLNLQNKTPAELKKIADAVASLIEDRKYHRLKYIYPETGSLSRHLYPKHMEVMRKGATKRFRCFAGGNRTGKSYWMGVELAYHVTDEYPDWWEGKVFKRISTVWIVAESAALWRDSLQILLFGKPGEDVGTGLLPLAEKNNGVGIVSYHALPGGGGGAIGTCIIKNKKGHMVSIVVKTNEMTREQFQAAKVDIVAFDEEPREDIYTECMMRLMGAGKEPGIAMFAFTPLKGLSNVVLRFLPDGQFPTGGSPIDAPEKFILAVEWDDVPHLSKEDKDTMIADMHPNERGARTKGIPTLGAGRIYPVDEDFVVVKPFEIPEYWPRCFGLDFGAHNTAAVWVAQDPGSGVKYVYSEYKKKELTVAVLHAEAIKMRGEWIPGAADPSGGGIRDDGTQLIDYYRVLGINLVKGENSIAAGLARIQNQFESGGLKIFSTCPKLLAEVRVYRYDTNFPNKPAAKQDDHLCDALKYCDSMFDIIATSEIESQQDSNHYDDYMSDPRNNSRDSTTGY